LITSLFFDALKLLLETKIDSIIHAVRAKSTTGKVDIIIIVELDKKMTRILSRVRREMDEISIRLTYGLNLVYDYF